MEILPPTSTCLDLSIAMPGSSSPPSPCTPSGAGTKAKAKGGGGDAAINEAAASEERPKSPKARKKLRLTKEQSGCLEESFLKKQGLNPKEKEVLAMELRLKARQVEVWFQNRRARSKMKQTGIECDYLKRWFGVLKEQNRKLHKQVEELRIMKSCPRCHRSTAPSASDPINSSNGLFCNSSLLLIS